jgi:hypothetical protein
MLSAEQNDLITRIGPATPAGMLSAPVRTAAPISLMGGWR